MGTRCQNLPQVHDVIQALREAVRIAAPAVIFKAEAIVGPDDLLHYLGTGRHEGHVSALAYHNSLMVQLWSCLATGDARLATHTLARHFPERVREATWATYLRCHDDIGWAITEEDAASIPHTDGPGHRRFLAEFYAGRFPGSFARGEDFQVDEATGDRRTNGTAASLAGLEAALEARDPGRVELAVRRIPDGPRPDRRMGRDPADLHGRRDRPDERSLVPGRPRACRGRPLDAAPRHALGRALGARPADPRGHPPHPRPARGPPLALRPGAHPGAVAGRPVRAGLRAPRRRAPRGRVQRGARASRGGPRLPRPAGRAALRPVRATGGGGGGPPAPRRLRRHVAPCPPDGDPAVPRRRPARAPPIPPPGSGPLQNAPRRP